MSRTSPYPEHTDRWPATLSAPRERDLPGNRHHVLQEYLMNEFTTRPRPRVLARLGLARLGLAAATAAAAAAAAVAVLVGTLGGSAAWAVEENQDTVTVTINEFTDASGLQERLRQAGIPALVEYVRSDYFCERPLPAEPRMLGEVLVDERQEDGVHLVIRRGVLTQDETLNVMIYLKPGNGPVAVSDFVAMSNGVLQGPVGPCQPTDRSLYPTPPGS